MNATQLEALVIRAVDAVRRGDGNEDDRIEFKRLPGIERVTYSEALTRQAPPPD